MQAKIRQLTLLLGTDLPLAAGLIAIDVIARLLPHAWNVSPVAASALFAGMVLRSRMLALAVPLSAMLGSDLVLGRSDWAMTAVVYIALLVPALLGICARGHKKAVVIVPLVIASSTIFFLATNFAVWALSGMYEHTSSGLLQCYLAALPFFHQTLAGDAFWTVVLFGGYWMAGRLHATRHSAHA